MDKSAEFKVLRQVFGRAADAAVPGEAPDFKMPWMPDCLGIEVTSFYLNPGDAKLRRVESYTARMLVDDLPPHRNDQTYLTVSDLTLLNTDGSTLDTVRGIVQRIPGLLERVHLLFDTILVKEGKCKSYRSECGAVDLIIEDGSQMFHMDNAATFDAVLQGEDFKRRLIESPFREVFLVTGWVEKHYMPLRTRIFAVDVLVFSSLISEVEGGKIDGRLLVSCLVLEGYRDVVVAINPEECDASVRHGAYEVRVSKDGIVIREWSAVHDAYRSDRAEDILASSPPGIADRAREFVVRRAGLCGTVDIRMPVKSD